MIILASASPRRKELLARITQNFVVCPVDVDETFDPSLSPEEAVLLLSARKAKAALAQNQTELIIAADTVVAKDGYILGKPQDEFDARQMLRILSGTTHEVFTGVTICRGEKEQSFAVRSEVTFYPLTDKEIDQYIRSGEPMDKAGAYGIQGLGGLLVEKIDGDYYNIVGLPIAALSRALAEFDK